MLLPDRVLPSFTPLRLAFRRDYFHYIPKYSRYEKRHSNTPAHISPCFRCNIGDTVTIGECRPLSKASIVAGNA